MPILVDSVSFFSDDAIFSTDVADFFYKRCRFPQTMPWMTDFLPSVSSIFFALFNTNCSFSSSVSLQLFHRLAAYFSLEKRHQRPCVCFNSVHFLARVFLSNGTLVRFFEWHFGVVDFFSLNSIRQWFVFNDQNLHRDKKIKKKGVTHAWHSALPEKAKKLRLWLDIIVLPVD